MKKVAMLAVGVLFSAIPLWVVGQETTSGAGSTTAPGPVIVTATRPPEHFYKLNFTVEEVGDEGKVINARSYVDTVSTASRHPQQIRTGARIPVAMSENQWQYMDVGVDFDVFEPKEAGDRLAFDLTADISSLASAANGGSEPTSHPVVRQNKWSSSVVIPIGKSTVVFSADDLDSKGKMQVEATATRVE